MTCHPRRPPPPRCSIAPVLTATTFARKSCAGWKAPTTANCFSNIGNPKGSVLTMAASRATYDTAQGFGLRAVKNDAVGYAHSSDVSLPALIRAADAVHSVRGGYSGNFAAAPGHTNVRLYGDENPLDGHSFETKVKLLAEIDAYVRDKDPRVRQVSVSLGATWQIVEIVRPDGESYRDIRPLVRVNISVVAGERRPAGKRLSWLWRARGLCALHRDRGMARPPPMARSVRHWSIWNRFPRLRAKWTWCSAQAGPA